MGDRYTMNHESSHQQPPRFLIRHFMDLVTLLTFLFILQTGLVPYDFTGIAGEGKGHALFSMAVSNLVYADIVSNIFLYVPLGMFCQWTLRRKLRLPLVAVLLTLLLGGLLSVGIEWIQAYSPSRVSSLIDVVSNVIGTVLGAALSWVVGWTAPVLGRLTIGELQQRPKATITKIYCFALLFLATVPFSVSFDISRLKQSVKSVNVTPFKMSETNQAMEKMAILQGDARTFDHIHWQRLKRWSRWAAECTSFIVLAWLLMGLLRMEYQFGRLISMLLVLWLGGLFAIVLSMANFLVISRMCDITDLIFRGSGLLIGLITRGVYLRRANDSPAQGRQPRLRSIAKLGALCTAIFIIYNGIIPGIFERPAGGPYATVQSENFLPFYAYFQGRFDLMMDDVMEKVSAYFVFASLLAFASLTSPKPTRKVRISTITLLGLLIASSIEIAQMYIPLRITSLTDLILACIGCVTGAIACEQAYRFYQTNQKSTLRRPPVAPPAPVMDTTFGPTDALIASLMDPRQDAPVEPSPANPTNPTHLPPPG